MKSVIVAANDPRDKSKMKILTSDSAKQSGAVDPNRQVMREELNQKTQFNINRMERGEASKPRVTSRILLNKWQRRQEKDYYHSPEFAARVLQDEERYQHEEEQSHWGCSFFRHCWNEGLKLPTRNNCPECSEQYLEYRQARANRHSIHERLGRKNTEDNRREKMSSYDNSRKKKLADQYWAYHTREEAQNYVWQRGQWCPPGLRKSQKRRVQHLRNTKMRQAEIREKKKSSCGNARRNLMTALLLVMCLWSTVSQQNSELLKIKKIPEERYSDFDETEFQGLMAQLVLSQKAVFDKPAKNRHLKALYLKGYVNGKPLTKMLVDGGAAINIMPYNTFRKLGMEDGDILKTDIILKDFAGNKSDTKGAVHVELMIGSKTLITTFFVISGKGAYSILLGRDWIHANCCIPSTMHQMVIQWIGDHVEVVHADDSVSVAASELNFWEYDGVDCFYGKEWEEGPITVSRGDQQPIQAIGSDSDLSC